MKTISNSEFLANPEMWLDEAREQDVCVKKGNAMFHIIYKADDEPTDEQTERALAAWLHTIYPDGMPPLGSDEEEIARSITAEELLRGIDEDLDRKWAERQRR